jgi:hypothetical protein
MPCTISAFQGFAWQGHEIPTDKSKVHFYERSAQVPPMAVKDTLGACYDETRDFLYFSFFNNSRPVLKTS